MRKRDDFIPFYSMRLLRASESPLNSFVLDLASRNNLFIRRWRRYFADRDFTRRLPEERQLQCVPG